MTSPEYLILGESLGFWIQTGAFCISAAAAIFVIRQNGKQAKRRATIDLMLHQKSDSQLLNDLDTIRELTKKNNFIFSSLLNEQDSDDFKAALRVLNNHEFIALGIRKGAFDERMYKMSQCSNMLTTWSNTSGLILEIRKLKEKDTFFQEFENLAERWKNCPIDSIKNRNLWWKTKNFFKSL